AHFPSDRLRKFWPAKPVISRALDDAYAMALVVYLANESPRLASALARHGAMCSAYGTGIVAPGLERRLAGGRAELRRDDALEGQQGRVPFAVFELAIGRVDVTHHRGDLMERHVQALGEHAQVSVVDDGYELCWADVRLAKPAAEIRVGVEDALWI